MPKKEKGSNEINIVLLRTTNNKIELNYGTDILVEESVFKQAEVIINEFPWDNQ